MFYLILHTRRGDGNWGRQGCPYILTGNTVQCPWSCLRAMQAPTARKNKGQMGVRAGPSQMNDRSRASHQASGRRVKTPYHTEFACEYLLRRRSRAMGEQYCSTAWCIHGIMIFKGATNTCDGGERVRAFGCNAHISAIRVQSFLPMCSCWLECDRSALGETKEMYLNGCPAAIPHEV